MRRHLRFSLRTESIIAVFAVCFVGCGSVQQLHNASAPAATAVNVYVAKAGNDSNPGSLDFPFATLERARDAVRAHADRGRLPVTVWLGAGTYEVQYTFELTEQ